MFNLWYFYYYEINHVFLFFPVTCYIPFYCIYHVLGFATQLAPMYLAEITPYNLRGAFGTANQLFVTLGIFLGALFGLTHILGKDVFCLYIYARKNICRIVKLLVTCH
jgi:hypothetical protein